VLDYAHLEQAVATYAMRAAEKLRRQESVCQYITVSIRTSPFKKDSPYYANHATIGLVYPTDSSVLLVKMAKRALKRIYQPGLPYQKAMVGLADIQPKGAMQLDIFAQNPNYSANARSDAVMAVLDRVNAKMGRGTLQLAAEGLAHKQAWQMRRNLCSPRYTTRIDEVLTVF
jgi:DNA polymerase V